MNAPTSPVTGRIADVRAELARHKLAALIVPSADPHLSEYLPDRWQGRRWLSGFTGSMGTLIVTPDFAGLWADSRYWTQAEKQLGGTGIELVKIDAGISTAHIDWLAGTIPAGGVVAVDGNVLGLATSRELQEKLSRRGVGLRTDLDLLEEIWKDRPGMPANPMYEHAMPHAAIPRAEKLAMVRKGMTDAGADWHVVSSLDDIAWIFNLRGSDVDYNPVFVSHALIGADSATIFVEPGKVDSSLAGRLRADGITVIDYAAFGESLSGLPATNRVLVDPGRVTLGTVQKLPKDVTLVEAVNPSTFAKSRKTAPEAEFVRQAMRQDGAALCEFFAWLEGALSRGERITELTVDEKICAARAKRPGFVGPSFGTIAGFNENGALPHYRATDESHAVIEGDGLLLIDSGGQYLGGTTDITRVVAVGTPTSEQKRDLTLVLKGMIQLSMARFPRGIRSTRLDSLARAPIWAAGIDYGHGTGHGVGYFLNVHEGPQSISGTVTPMVHHAMEPGMITSNEPGIYRPGRWGARVENLTLTVPAGEGEFGEFLAFETLTLCPIDTRCVERELLDERELQWLNAYHATVREQLKGLVQGSVQEWLLTATEPL